MRVAVRAGLAGLLAIVAWEGVENSRVSAQGLGPGASLGGYGGSMSGGSSGAAMSGPIIPYGGQFGGFMPSRMGGGSSLSFQSRGPSRSGIGRAPFSLSPMSGGMGGAARPFSTFGSQGGIGMGGGPMRPMPGAGGMGVMPPSFGYPFYQPPILLAPGPGVGMSM